MFFNTSVDRVAGIGDSTPDGLPVERVDARPGGLLVLTNGEPLVADYVATLPEIELTGRRIARGTSADLVLWETRGVVRMADPRLRTRHLMAASCG